MDSVYFPLNDTYVVFKKIYDHELTMRTHPLIGAFNKHLWQADILIN